MGGGSSSGIPVEGLPEGVKATGTSSLPAVASTSRRGVLGSIAMSDPTSLNGDAEWGSATSLIITLGRPHGGWLDDEPVPTSVTLNPNARHQQHKGAASLCKKGQIMAKVTFRYW